MVRVLHDEREPYAACGARLLGYYRAQYARDGLTLAQLEQRVERVLSDSAWVERERQTWTYR